MENPLYIGLSRQVALRRQLDVVANNIANMNTAGFKANRLVFEAAVQQAGRTKTDEVAFTIDRATYTDMREGSISETGNVLDVAIQGDGWLTVETPDGVRYTRDGRLKRDAEGQIVNNAGFPVLDQGGQPLAIPDDARTIIIAPDGALSVDGEPVARLGLVRFDNPQLMTRDAGGLFATDQPPQPAPEARLAQGKIENANVQPIVEMATMMEMTRDYQAVSKMIEESQELLRSAIGRLGKTS